MIRAAFFALVGVAALCAAAPARAASWSGVTDGPSVVWVTDVVPSPPPNATIRQTAKTFVPAVLVIPVGTSVVFPNDDPFYHSVYSESPGNAFDLGLYDTGPGKSVRFDTVGVVDVHCHVHGSMHASIVVVDGPYAQTTQPHERYRIDGLTPGRHALHVWSGGATAATSTITIR